MSMDPNPNVQSVGVRRAVLDGKYHARMIDEQAMIDLNDESLFSDLGEQDEFTKLIWDVRNILFNLPHSMFIGRYRYMCNELLRLTNHGSFLLLQRSDLKFTPEEYNVIHQIPSEIADTFRQITVRHLCNSARDIDSMQNTPRGTIGTATRYTQDIIIHDGSRINIRTEHYVITTCAERDKEYLLRLKLSECPTVPVRSMLLLSDRAIPLRVIPGLDTLSDVRQMLYGHAKQLQPSRQCAIDSEWN